MNANSQRDTRPERYPIQKEDRIDPMWLADENDRRRAIALRAAAGARKALKASKPALAAMGS